MVKAKIKKIIKYTQKAILLLSIITFAYIYNRFSVYYIDTPVDIESTYLRAGYLLVDWQYHRGRSLKKGDLVIYSNFFRLGYISAIFPSENSQEIQYLIYSLKEENTIFISQKELNARVLMNILQK